MYRLISLMCLSIVTGVSRGEEWQALFNGQDLASWRANFDPESFTVVDGAIRVQALSEKRAHLFFVGDRTEGLERFKNFELEATVRAEPNSNGGIFVHTEMTTRDAARHLAKGYEVQLNSTEKEKRKTGSLYAIVDLDSSPVDETKWFKVRVVVQDKRIIVSLDGQQVVDYIEPEGVQRPPTRAGRLFAAEGDGLALQAHDNGSVWFFKDIRIKRLP